ncbi:hypothetical protein J6590_017920 [Homalodisca vitripennis]|nr:hypothetical protein J6590_017920 [Homalodisca vitripennis]
MRAGVRRLAQRGRLQNRTREQEAGHDSNRFGLMVTQCEGWCLSAREVARQAVWPDTIFCLPCASRVFVSCRYPRVYSTVSGVFVISGILNTALTVEIRAYTGLLMPYGPKNEPADRCLSKPVTAPHSPLPFPSPPPTGISDKGEEGCDCECVRACRGPDRKTEWDCE